MLAKPVRASKPAAYYIAKLLAVQSQDKEVALKRHALFPILDESGYRFYQQSENTHWSAIELSFVKDVPDYQARLDKERRTLDGIMAYFLVGDGGITENLIYRFLPECESIEERMMFISQLHIETIHAETYGMFILAFKRSESEVARLLVDALDSPYVQAKMNYIEKWMLLDAPKYQRFTAFACVEGIHFCTLFAVVFWFRSRGLLKNFCAANELISADESLHRDYAVHKVKKDLFHLRNSGNGINEDEVEAIIRKIILEALDVEYDFIQAILPEALLDLNAEDLKQYSQLIADNLLTSLGYAPEFYVENPFTWMDDISMERKGNFLEVSVQSYKKRALEELLNWRARVGLDGTKAEDRVDAYAHPEEVDV